MACQIAHAAKPKSRATCMLEDDLGLQDTRTKILQDFSAHKNVNRNTPNIVISTHPWLCPSEAGETGRGGGSYLTYTLEQVP